MKLRLFQIDAFSERLFEGNPAAVVPLESWLPDAFLQSIASENNLSETAFFVPSEPEFHLRGSPRPARATCPAMPLSFRPTFSFVTSVIPGIHSFSIPGAAISSSKRKTDFLSWTFPTDRMKYGEPVMEKKIRCLVRWMEALNDFLPARLRHVRLFKFLFGIKGTKILEGEIGNDYGPPYR